MEMQSLNDDKLLQLQPFYGSLDNLGWPVPEGTFCCLLDFLVQNENAGSRTSNPDGLPTHPD